MTSLTAGDVLVNTLMTWGVDTVFGIPGDGINGIDRIARRRYKDKSASSRSRHEEAAAFAACAYAKFTGKLGVLHRHLRTGRHPSAERPLRREARRRRPCSPSPDFSFTTSSTPSRSRTWSSTSSSWTSPCTTTRVMGAAHMENVVELACRTALAYRGVAHVTMPGGFPGQCRSTRSVRSPRNVPTMCRRNGPAAPMLPSEERLAPRGGTAERRQEGGDPRRPRRTRRRDASSSRSPRGSARPSRRPFSARRVVPDDSPYTTGGIGLLGTRPSQEALEELRHAADRRQFSFPYIEFYPEAGHGALRSDRP